MNSKHRSVFPVITLLLLGLMPLLGADEFTVEFHQFGIGGGTSSSAEFSITGSIGEVSAGGSTAADEFSIQGGLGVVVALATEYAPVLAVSVVANGAIKVHWPASAVGWELRKSRDLTTGAWESPPESTQQDAGQRFILIVRPAAIRFFRLIPAPR